MASPAQPQVWTVTGFAEQDLGNQMFMVDPVLPLGGIMFVYAKRNTGKTPFGMSLMASVAGGEHFLDRFPTLRGRVCYIQADMPEVVHQDRVRKAFDWLRDADENIRLVHCPNAIDVMQQGFPRQPWVQEIVEWQPDLVIVDSLKRVHTLPESDNDTPGLVYGRFKEVFGRSTFTFLHHDKKTQWKQDGKAIKDPEESFRGASDWLDHADCGIHLTKERKKDAVMTVTWTKLRTCEHMDPFKIEIDPEAIVVTALRSEADREIIRFCREHPHMSARQVAEALDGRLDIGAEAIRKRVPRLVRGRKHV